MNYKLILRILGRTVQMEGAAMCLPLAVCLLYGEDPLPFLIAVVPALICGTLLARLHSADSFFSREGYAAVGLIWIALCLLGAVPFWISGCFGGYIDCLFEIVSGFSTTGASILTDIEAVPKGLLFWRSFSSWIGGMGVLIFTLAFLPKTGRREQMLAAAESPGPIFTKLVPRASESSRLLYGIYILLTAAELLLLKLAGLPLYDAIVTAMATVCTGGFSVMNTSIAAYANPVCEWIVIVFMLLGSINFSLFFLAATGRGREILKSDELKFFLGFTAILCAAIFLSIRPLYGFGEPGLRTAVFQVLAVISTTGFSTADFNVWPGFAKLLLIAAMCTGGCAGSTAGGMKCARVLLLCRSAGRTLRRVSHPRAVKVVKLDGNTVAEDTLQSAAAFFVCWCLILFGTSLILSLDNVSVTTACTAALTCLGNVGPGLDAVGPAANFAHLSGVSKLVLCFSMLAGRLEIFPILTLLRLPMDRR